MVATMRGMTSASKDRDQYRADLAAYEAYSFDGKVVDGIRHDLLGIGERDGGREVLRGAVADLPARPADPMDRQARVPVTVRLTMRVPDLPLDRAAELIRNAFFHHHTAHYHCERIAQIVVKDEADGSTSTVPFDDC